MTSYLNEELQIRIEKAKRLAENEHEYFDLIIQMGCDCCSEGCDGCSIRDCPHDEPLHYHHDGCPACYVFDQKLK